MLKVLHLLINSSDNPVTFTVQNEGPNERKENLSPLCNIVSLYLIGLAQEIPTRALLLRLPGIPLTTTS